MRRRFSVVTTFNQAGYERYGSRMIDTFLANWPRDIELHVYAENCSVSQTADNLHVIDFVHSVPELTVFKQRWITDPRATGRLAMGPPDKKGKQPGIGFKWDAVRFCHKVYAVCDLAENWETDIVMWMDADTVCHSPISRDFFEQQVPREAGIAYLGREGKYSECGLYALNMRYQATRDFVRQFRHAYDDAEHGIFTMREWHDSYVFDRIREQVQTQNPTWQQLDWAAGLIVGEGHPLINSEWGAYLDHLKGDRKDLGRSKPKDLKVQRGEAYWQ
jgi:hypothetical protein